MKNTSIKVRKYTDTIDLTKESNKALNLTKHYAEQQLELMHGYKSKSLFDVLTFKLMQTMIRKIDEELERRGALKKSAQCKSCCGQCKAKTANTPESTTKIIEIPINAETLGVLVEALSKFTK